MNESKPLGLNKATLVGVVGDHPKPIEIRGEVAIITFFPFMTNSLLEDGEETTQWHLIRAVGKQASLINKFVKKGDSLYIEGSIINKRYDDDYRTTEIRVNSFLFLQQKK